MEFFDKLCDQSLSVTELNPRFPSADAHHSATHMKLAKTLKLLRMHRTIRYCEFIGSKIKLPIDKTTPMELRGGHQEDTSILKVNKISNWMWAWLFMEMCGFTGDAADENDTPGADNDGSA
jgi:hypothetical protein